MERYLSYVSHNIIAVSGLALGFVLLCIGGLIKPYKVDTEFLRKYRESLKESSSHTGLLCLDSLTSIFPFGMAKNYIKSCLSLPLSNEYRLILITNTILLILLSISGGFALAMHGVGQLWYVKILVVTMSIILPFYIFGLVSDLYKYTISRSIPVLIDEFRSAFINTGKIKPALLECSRHVDGGLGRLIKHAADSPFIEDGLTRLKDRLNNVWFNIFVTLLINFKENSGDLVDQLYKLNRTMTRYINVEKKKNRRLIWYEIFAVSASIVSIPVVFWINSAVVIGQDMHVLVDARTNLIISRIIGYSIISLIVIRILRSL